uniref:Uncharacterized protein n=1 Tax=Glossina austeni TaxID=7395 RepID=A0A1A9V8F3_GLOAU
MAKIRVKIVDNYPFSSRFSYSVAIRNTMNTTVKILGRIVASASYSSSNLTLATYVIDLSSSAYLSHKCPERMNHINLAGCLALRSVEFSAEDFRVFSPITVDFICIRIKF